MVRVAAVFIVLALIACVAVNGEDYYDLLGLGTERDEATPQQIKTAFRGLSKKYHPDQHPSDEMRERYIKIQRAYEVLSDRKKRKIYDMKGEDGLKQLEESQRNPHHDDPIMQMFGMGGGGGTPKGQSVEMRMEVSLADIYNGKVHQVQLNKQKLCRKCKGTGAASEKDFSVCSQCRGKGVVLQRIQLAPGFVQQMQQPCPKCGGKGRMVSKPCPHCGGRRVVQASDALEIVVEKGIPDGHKIVYEMEADESPEAIPGDVIIVIVQQKDSKFTRKGNDLETTLKISLREALLGFRRTIRHMDDHEVEVSRSTVTPFGTKIKIPQEGMPKHGTPSEKGDLIVTVEFSLPHSLTEQQKQAVEELL